MSATSQISKPTPIVLLPSAVGSDVLIRGWILTVRAQKMTVFLTVSDGTSAHNAVQVVSAAGEQIYTVQSYVEVVGTVIALTGKHTTHSGVELRASQITVIGPSASDYPGRCPPDATPFVKLEERHLDLRNDKAASTMKCLTYLIQAIRRYFKESSAEEIFPPSFVGNQCEGGSTLFKVAYPDGKGGTMEAFLTQSSQFYCEFEIPVRRTDVFCIAPSFRAESHCHTRRHLTEFQHAECEWKDIFTFEDHVQKLKDLMVGIVKEFRRRAAEELKKLGLEDHINKIVAMCDDIMILTHAEAIAYCREHNIYKDPETQTHFDPEDDIPEAQERQMIDQIGKIVFLSKFPHAFKSFYFARDSVDPNLVLGVDVEVPGVGEIIGSGIREYDHDRLLANIVAAGLKPEEYRELLDLRKYGHARTSGMGLGVGRMLCWLLNSHSIREVTPFPRFAGRLTP